MRLIATMMVLLGGCTGADLAVGDAGMLDEPRSGAAGDGDTGGLVILAPLSAPEAGTGGVAPGSGGSDAGEADLDAGMADAGPGDDEPPAGCEWGTRGDCRVDCGAGLVVDDADSLPYVEGHPLWVEWNRLFGQHPCHEPVCLGGSPNQPVWRPDGIYQDGVNCWLCEDGTAVDAQLLARGECPL